MKRLSLLVLLLTTLTFAVPVGPPATAQEPTDPAARETEPVVLTGDRFPEWAVPADVALEGPTANGALCEGNGHSDPGEEPCTHNRYEDPDWQSSDHIDAEGVGVDRLLGYRWDAELGEFEQIPFQVDEMFVRYLSNNNSGFAFYSETDQHTAYAFDREGFRWTEDHGDDPDSAGDPMASCLAKPDSEVAKDPVKGLDTDDELVFMDKDAGVRAPSTALVPAGVQDSYEVAIADPTSPGDVGYAYVMLAGPEGPAAAFDETNGYVHYERDEPEGRNVFLYSQSSYDGYGAAPKGPVFDPRSGECGLYDEDNNPATPPVEVQRRPSDKATISTPRYRFRYDGRWLMTGLEVSNDPNGDWTYGPDLIDQWKARAFQQRPSGQTPCCGYEEEVNNWGGSSIMMGELSGPVRTIRETWGADSGTNVVRREIFYRDEIRFGSFLRVHVIPPLDGIYAQWDYNAGEVDTYYNPFNPDGVAIDGQNDEVFGNSRVHAGPDGITYDGNDDFSDALDDATGSEEQGTGTTNEPSCRPVGPHSPIYEQFPEEMRNQLEDGCIYNDVDSPDPTFSGAVAGLNWEEVAGDEGTLVFRNAIKQFTPGGTAQGLIAVPYYRDDSCFDDGTGSDPGPHLNGRNADTGTTATYNGAPRKCWTPEDGEVDKDPQFWQGSIGTHGVHILVIAESDNAHSTVPVTEIDTEQRMVVLPGDQGNVGEAYGRAPEKPLIVTTAPESRAASAEPEQKVTALEITGARSGQITDETTLSARLTSEGQGVAGKEIVFALDGQEVGRDETDDSGAAGVTITLQPPARLTDQTSSWAGDDEYTGSSASDSFDVQRDDSTLTLSLTSKGNRTTATSELSDSDDGAGLGGRTLHFLVNGTEVASAITDASGGATASFKAKKRDTIRAVFDGDDSYSGSSAEQVRQ